MHLLVTAHASVHSSPCKRVRASHDVKAVAEVLPCDRSRSPKSRSLGLTNDGVDEFVGPLLERGRPSLDELALLGRVYGIAKLLLKPSKSA